MSSVLGLRGCFASKAEVEQLFGEIILQKVVLTLGEGGAEQSREFSGEAFVQLDPADAAQALNDLRDSRYVECVTYCPREFVTPCLAPPPLLGTRKPCRDVSLYSRMIRHCEVRQTDPRATLASSLMQCSVTTGAPASVRGRCGAAVVEAGGRLGASVA